MELGMGTAGAFGYGVAGTIPEQLTVGRGYPQSVNTLPLPGSKDVTPVVSGKHQAVAWLLGMNLGVKRPR